MSVASSILVYKIIKALVTPWNKTQAFKMGLIDKDGRSIRSPITKNEKNAYTLFDKFVFNLKRAFSKIPLIGSKFGSYMFAAMFLLKEHCELTNDDLGKIVDELEIKFEKPLIKEGSEPIIGQYELTEEIASPKTGEVIARKGTKIQFEQENPIADMILGVPIYEARHIPTNQTIFVSHFSFK